MSERVEKTEALSGGFLTASMRRTGSKRANHLERNARSSALCIRFWASVVRAESGVQ